MHAHWISKARDGTACTTVQASNGYARRQICIAAYVRATTTSRDVSQMTEQITILQTKCAHPASEVSLAQKEKAES